MSKRLAVLACLVLTIGTAPALAQTADAPAVAGLMPGGDFLGLFVQGAAHAMARLHQRYDLVLCPTVPAGPALADAPTVDPVRALWTDWAPWTFTFNLTRQPAISVPMGPRADGMPNSVQIAAAQFRDDLVLRAARAIEMAQPFQLANLK